MPPRSRMCHICGRQCMVNSFKFHIKECQALFEKRENLKPVRERRACPDDPYTYHKGQTLRKADIDDMNTAAYEAWNKTLSQCANCGRRFLPEKLVIHNKSCTAKTPARSVVSLLHTGTRKSFNESVPLRRRNSGHGIPPPSSAPVVPAELITCSTCGRHFNEIAYSKHHRVCKKVFATKRKPYDSAKARARGTDLELYYRRSARQPAGSKTSGNKTSKWRTESMQFREAIRAARREKYGVRPLSVSDGFLVSSNRSALPPRQTYSSYSGLIPCPSCGRSFSESAAARHIPQCRNIIHKPSVLMRGSGRAAYTSSSNNSLSVTRPRSLSAGRGFFKSNGASSQPVYKDVKDIHRNGPSIGLRKR